MGEPRVMRMRVKNVSISDANSHQIIFQRVYAWKATTAFNNLGNLIESFYQFARTVDDGVVVGIDFESTPKEVLRRRRDDTLWDVRGDTMHMMTVKTDDFTVTTFFDLNGKIVAATDDQRRFEIFLHTIKIAFSNLYLDKLRTLRSQHQMLGQQHHLDEPIPMNTAIFSDFLPLVDTIHEQIFGLATQRTQQYATSTTPFANTSAATGAAAVLLNDLGNNEKQLDSWLSTQQPQQLSVEEEVRKCLEAVHIHVDEIILEKHVFEGP